MKKYVADTGTIHLFDDLEVRRRRGSEVVESHCGTVEAMGPFTDLRDDPDDLEDLCKNCAKGASDDE